MKSIVIRHAERIKFPSEQGVHGPKTNEDDTPITEVGRKAATEYGAGLKRAIERIFTSPVRRCIETAESLAQGAGEMFQR